MKKCTMKRTIVIIVSLILTVICCTACGSQSGQSAESTGISTENSGSETAGQGSSASTDISEIFQGQNKQSELVWAGTQFYNGEAVVLWRQSNGSEDMQKALDVFMHDSGNNSKKIVSGAPGVYTGKWFYTNEGFCLTTFGSELARIEADGTEKFNIPVEGGVSNLIQLDDGTIVLLLKDANNVYRLAVLDPEKGEYRKISDLDLGTDSRVYIASDKDGVVLLNKGGFWDVNLENGELTERIPLSEYDYSVQYTVKAFRLVGGGCVQMLYKGSSDILIPKDIEKYRTVITVQDYNNHTWLEAQLDKFNKSNYQYYAVLETFDSGTSQVVSGEQLLEVLADKTGPDVIMGGCFDDGADVVWAIENGYLEDISPYMEQSGIYVEDYFPTAFDAYTYGDSIYGAALTLDTVGWVISEELLGSRDIPTAEELADAMLAYTEPAMFSASSSNILRYFLRASESLCGTVDWENKTCNFHTNLFAKILEAALLYGNDGTEDVPVVQHSINTQFYHYLNKEQRKLAGEVYIGYLFDNGSYPSVINREVVHMNRNSLEKEGAWAVMAYLLSEEAQTQDGLVQKGTNGREDIPYVIRDLPANVFAFETVVLLEKEETSLVHHLREEGRATTYKAGRSEEDKKLTDEAYRARYDLTDEDVEEILELLYTARHTPTKTEPIQDIISEEAKSYFNGERSLGDTCDAIQQRVQAYLDGLE